MCFASSPKISVPDTQTPAPLPPNPEEAKKVESVDFGGSASSDTQSASGIKGEKATGKGSLKIKKTTPTTTTKTGANLQ